MLRDYHTTLDLTFQARDRDEALEIAAICARAIEEYDRQPYKVAVNTDDVEEV